MVELEETFITQLQRVADTYKREMQEQHSIRSDTEVRLRAAQLAVHQADTQREEAQAAFQALQVTTPGATAGPILAAPVTWGQALFCCNPKNSMLSL